jgi:hypothetical protein
MHDLLQHVAGRARVLLALNACACASHLSAAPRSQPAGSTGALLAHTRFLEYRTRALADAYAYAYESLQAHTRSISPCGGISPNGRTQQKM